MVRKGFLIDDKLIENPNGNFYTFDSAADLKAFFERQDALGEDEEMPCATCGATMTEIELFNNNNCCWNCGTRWNSI